MGVSEAENIDLDSKLFISTEENQEPLSIKDIISNRDIKDARTKQTSSLVSDSIQLFQFVSQKILFD